MFFKSFTYCIRWMITLRSLICRISWFWISFTRVNRFVLNMMWNRWRICSGNINWLDSLISRTRLWISSTSLMMFSVSLKKRTRPELNSHKASSFWYL